MTDWSQREPMPKDTFLKLPADKRKLIERVAIDEFADNSLQSASVNAIVHNAGIAKGSFYQYFENLEDLYNHVLSLVRERKLELMQALPLQTNGLDTFAYLERLIRASLAFELTYPQLSKVERRHNFENPISSSIDPETGQRFFGDGRFHAFLQQGVYHEDIATWLDTDMAAYVLTLISQWVSPYLLDRLKQDSVREISADYDLNDSPLLHDLIQNLMDILMAGMARDPQIRKDFYNK